MKNELISVVIPVYNVLPYLDRCLESVVNQTYQNMEILLINDGSTDGSADKCREWECKDYRINFINKENEGLGPTRNCGIRNARGKYLIFIDSDDWWELNTVEKLYCAAEKYDADIVYMNFYFSYLDERGKLTEDIFIRHHLFDGVSTPAEQPELIFELGDSRMWSKLFKKELFTKNHIFMPSHPFEDFPVMPLLVLAAQRVCQVHEGLYHYFYKRKDNLVGSLGSYPYIYNGLKELYGEFVKRGYEAAYRKPLKAYLYHMCKFALNDLPAKQLSEREYAEYEKPFLNLIAELVPEKTVNTKWRAVLWGSYSNRLVVYNLLTKQSQIAEHYMFSSIISLLGDKWGQNVFCNKEAPENLFRRNMLKKEQRQCFWEDGDKLRNADYLFFDFMEEINGVVSIGKSYVTLSEAFQEQMVLSNSEYKIITPDNAEYMELWELACDKMVAYLRMLGVLHKVVLVKLFLAEYYGISAAHKQKYSEQIKIRKYNRLLKNMYKSFEKKTDGIIRTVSAYEMDNYTYEFTKYGCFPQYFNGKFYSCLASKIEKEQAGWVDNEF